MLRAACLAFVLALIAAAGASGEIVARGVRDGSLALGPSGAPAVAYVRGTSAIVSSRTAKSRWRTEKIGTVSGGSQVIAFKVGAAGPVALVESVDLRKITLFRRNGFAWQAITLAGPLPASVQLGFPGLVLDSRGLPVVAYTRWSRVNLDSRLLLARVDARGRVRTTQITREGFPKSMVPPPAAPVIVGGKAHVVESYGYKGSVATLEWYPEHHTWTGLGLDAGAGDYPVGPVLAGLNPAGTLFAAWTESLAWFGAVPVTLAMHANETTSRIVLDRALTTGLALPATGPEVAANEWVDASDLGLTGGSEIWAGTVVRRKSRVELDGWIAGYAVAPHGGRDLLLGGPAGLSWFRAPRRPATHVSLEAAAWPDGSVHLTGSVGGVATGKVTLYRERPGAARQAIGSAALAGGSFSLADRSSGGPVVYRAVYTDPATGIPYAALLRRAV